MALTPTLAWCQPADGEPLPAPLSTTHQKASYAIGLNIGKSLKQDGVPVVAEALLLGLQDALGQRPPRLTDAQLQAALIAFQQEVDAQAEQRTKAVGEKNQREGAEFLARNKAAQGVITLPSGLQYKVLKSGNGQSPGAGDQVTTHYRGTLLDGSEFDSSYRRGEPATFPVQGVIPGWTEALQKMKVGDKWQLFIPADLAYGQHGSPPAIGPHAVLVFEIELLEVTAGR